MQGQVQDYSRVMLQAPHSTYMLATVRLKVQQPRNYAFSLASTTPPVTAVNTVMQRGDEVNTVLRMLADVQTSTVILTGNDGAGRSLLAALVYLRLELMAQSGLPAPRHFVWLSIGAHTTLPDVIASILSGLKANEAEFFLLKPEQQILTLLHVLRHSQEPTLVVLDQFEELLDPETNMSLEGRGEVALFLEMLQQDLGVSRVLLTCYRSPYDSQYQEETRVRSFLVSRISLPEGVALLQQRGIQATYAELSLIWQRCGGHVFSLILLSALVQLSGFALSYLLDSPDYQSLWSSEVSLNLLAAVYHYLNPIQHTLIRTLSLFREPVPTRGIFMTIVGENPTAALPPFEQELGLLVQLALVQQVFHQEHEPCYALHPMFRQYVLEHYLEGSSSQPNSKAATSLGVIGSLTKPISSFEAYETREVAVAAGHMRVANYYQQLAQEHYLPREKRGGPQDIAFLLATIRHLCLGWHWQQACDLVLSEGIYESMVQWGAWNTLIGLYQGMLPPNGVLTRRDEGLICNHLGLLYDRLGNAQYSWTYYERALALQRKIDDQHGVALTLTNQGELFRNQSEWQHAYANFEQARDLNRQLRDPLLESVLLHNLGLLHHTVKDYQQALHYYQEALRFALTLEEHYNEGMILTNISILFYEQGFYPEALALLFYTLQMRQSLQYSTVSFIESFIANLEDNMEIDAFARLRQASRAVQEQVISRLIPANMRQ
ncbi:MAG: tetratricopeptide repeat protein [Ktedonobacteraceae bacterium]